MSGEKATGSCSKFQPNIFNKSKCQNCFKSREVHPLNDSDSEQARPIYAGWSCLAPVGTDFDNPMQRSRKWQRRFFISYENGISTYASDESPSTSPQGTVNMNSCTSSTDAEPKTGQRNALCIVTPAQETFIRGDSREIISGWSEQLTVISCTNKQNQKKKRKVDPVANQDPSPAKMAATGQSCPASEAGSADSQSWQEESHAARPNVTPVRTVASADPPGPDWTPAGSGPSRSCPTSRGSSTSAGAGRSRSSASSPDLAAAGLHNQPSESIGAQTSASGRNRRRDRSSNRSAEKSSGSELTGRAPTGGAAGTRQGRPDARTNVREKISSTGDASQLNVPPPTQRRSKSSDRRTSDTAMTPDLSNFKKGWMMKSDEDNEWKKYWFVLSTASSRFYKDSIAEESSNLEGEIDLTKCYSVSEYQVQRNYGFQIHIQKAVFTSSAMTAGIRKNWIQASMKNVHPANAPDVANLPDHHSTCSPPEVIPKPDVTQDSVSFNVPSSKNHPTELRNVTERRHEGHSKTFDWSELSSEKQSTLEVDRRGNRASGSSESGDSDRRRRREERRRRYESLSGFSSGRGETANTEGGAVQAASPKSQEEMAERIEECWRQVEKTMLRPERTVTSSAGAGDASESEKSSQGCRKMVDDSRAQSADSERRRLQMEAHLSTAGFLPEQDVPVSSEVVLSPADVNLKPSNDSDRWCRESLQQQDPHLKPASLASQSSGIWMHGTDSLLLAAPASNGQHGAPGSSRDERDDIPENHVATDQSAIKKLSQEVESSTSQNQALNQRNQEMVNQSTEADREIERSKVELGNRYTEPNHLPEVEQQEKMKSEDLERQSSSRNRELSEAQSSISSLEESSRETEASSQDERKESAGREESLQRSDATEAESTESQSRLGQSESTCRQSEQQNSESKERGEHYVQKAAEAEADVRRLTEEKQEEADGNRSIPAEEKIQQVIEGAAMRSQALRRLSELIDGLDFTEEEEDSAAVGSRSKWEEAFWKCLSNKMKSDSSQPEEPLGELLCEVMDGLMLEKQVVSVAHEMSLHPEKVRGCGTEEMDEKREMENGKEEGNCRFTDPSEDSKALTETKISSSKSLASSSISSSALDRLSQAAESLNAPYSAQHPASVSFIHSAATEAFCCCLSSRLRFKYERRICSSCVSLGEENEVLKTRSSASEERFPSVGTRTSTSCQTEEGWQQFTDTDSQRSGVADTEETTGSKTPSMVVGNISDKSSGGSVEDDSEMETQHMSDLRTKVDESEEQSRSQEDYEQKMRCSQEQHEREIAKSKATCERGLVAMEDCHLRVVEESQRSHQQEVERLSVERERSSQEESAATATAIEAIKSAHREESQREIQRRSRPQNSDGNTQSEETHREESASFQRELEVLSQQFSSKCSENGHSAQASDAERKALCQCQQENQDSRSRNQESSGHSAAEITRSCSSAKQDQLPLGHTMDAYEMEIMLRVKESEVQCSKQEVTSSKEESQAALKDKRNTTKKYKDAHTELSIFRAKAEREAEESRENSRSAHQASGEASL